MNLLLNTKPLDELGDLTAPIGSRKWLLGVANEIRKTLYDKEQTGRRLQDLIEVFKEHAGWQEFGYFTWEEYCTKRLQTEPEKVDTEATLREKAGGVPGNVNNPTGNNQYKRVDDSDNYQNHPAEEGKRQKSLGELAGTSAAYTLARLKRDEPSLYERVKRGELSANAAAIEAGWRNPKTRYSLPDDPQAAGRYLAERVDREWFDMLIDTYYKAISE